VTITQLGSLLDMDFPERLVQLRKARHLTQRQLGELVNVHFTQLQRYENGSSQPTLDVLRRLAVSLGVSADVLLFDQDERGPDETLKLKFEALRQFNEDERRIAEGVLDSLIVQHQAKRLFAAPAKTAAMPTAPTAAAKKKSARAASKRAQR
jgi:transcriptional regulator with XRE-family HTH domain